MLEATRLTRAGQLTEATTLLQQLLQGRAVPGNAPSPVEPTSLALDGVAETIGTAEAAALPCRAGARDWRPPTVLGNSRRRSAASNIRVAQLS